MTSQLVFIRARHDSEVTVQESPAVKLEPNQDESPAISVTSTVTSSSESTPTSVKPSPAASSSLNKKGRRILVPVPTLTKAPGKPSIPPMVGFLVLSEAF